MSVSGHVMQATAGWKQGLDARMGTLSRASGGRREGSEFVSHSAGNHGDEDQDKLHAIREVGQLVFQARALRAPHVLSLVASQAAQSL
jgi:hypothetical protein